VTFCRLNCIFFFESPSNSPSRASAAKKLFCIVERARECLPQRAVVVDRSFGRRLHGLRACRRQSWRQKANRRPCRASADSVAYLTRIISYEMSTSEYHPYTASPVVYNAIIISVPTIPTSIASDEMVRGEKNRW